MSSLSRYERVLCSWLAGMLSESRRERILQTLLNRTRHLTVVLEDVYDPHNASACIRSCDCFGVQDIHIIENQIPFEPRKDVTRGAAQWLTLHQHADDGDNTTRCLEQLRAQGYSLVVTTPHQTDCELESWDITRKTALIFGNEHNGVSPAALRLADRRMLIPMFGFTESFNLSVAVALCLHHLVWRLRQTGCAWRLPPVDRERMLLDWIRIAMGRKGPPIEAVFERDYCEGQPVSGLIDWPDWERVLSEADGSEADFDRRAAGSTHKG